MIFSSLSHLAVVFSAASVSPSPTSTVVYNDDNDPFNGGATFVVVVIATIAVILLGYDMIRRIRRSRYRQQVKEQLAEEYGVADEEMPKGKYDGLDLFQIAELKDREKEERRLARYNRRHGVSAGADVGAADGNADASAADAGNGVETDAGASADADTDKNSDDK